MIRLVIGSLLGTGLFIVGTFIFLITVISPFKAGTAIGLSVITGVTIHNPLFWLAFIASLVIGCAIAFSWRVEHL